MRLDSNEGRERAPATAVRRVRCAAALALALLSAPAGAGDDVNAVHRRYEPCAVDPKTPPGASGEAAAPAPAHGARVKLEQTKAHGHGGSTRPAPRARPAAPPPYEEPLPPMG